MTPKTATSPHGTPPAFVAHAPAPSPETTPGKPREGSVPCQAQEARATHADSTSPPGNRYPRDAVSKPGRMQRQRGRPSNPDFQFEATGKAADEDALSYLLNAT